MDGALLCIFAREPDFVATEEVRAKGIYIMGGEKQLRAKVPKKRAGFDPALKL